MNHYPHHAVIHISADDYLKAQWLHHRFSIRSMTWITVILLLLGSGVSMLLHDWIPITIAIAYLVFCLVYNLVYLRWRMARIYQQQKALHTPTQLEWDDVGLTFTHDSGQAHIKWSDFAKYKADKHIILLYSSDVLFSMVPTRTFDYVEQREDFMLHCAGIGKRSVKL